LTGGISPLANVIAEVFRPSSFALAVIVRVDVLRFLGPVVVHVRFSCAGAIQIVGSHSALFTSVAYGTAIVAPCPMGLVPQNRQAVAGATAVIRDL